MMYYSVFNQPAHLSMPITVACESFEDICAGLANPETYQNKQSLPGIKLATFNGKRNNDNVVGFSGIELDYDDGKMRPEEVSVILSHHGIKHFIYTTGSHLPFQPRFRVLVPFSDLYTKDVRNEIMNELTHLLNDSFAPESRTESQFFYYGQVEGVLYETFYSDGEFIDELELDIPEPVVVPKTLTPKSVDNNDRPPIQTIRAALVHVPGADEYPSWQSVGQALKSLGDDGYKLWVEWSRRSLRHNEQACLSKWDYLAGDRTNYRSLFNKASANGWDNTGNGLDEAGDWAEAKAVDRTKRSVVSMATNSQVLKLEQALKDEVYVLDEIALRGDLTVIYAASNSGKTLLTLHSLIDTVKSGRIRGEDIFYINADDNLRRSVEKMKLLIPHNIQCLIPGRNGFEIDELIPILSEMKESGELDGKIIVLDTLTKFINLMEKNKSRDFVQALRQFTTEGLTVIMLAHTNKTRGLDGKPIPEGTGDMKNNVDAVYVMDSVRSDDTNIVSVTFHCHKSRGSNAETIKFRFEKHKDSTYQTLLDSVVKVTENDIQEHRHQSAEYSAFDVDQIIGYIKLNESGLSLKELNKYGADSGIKHVKQIVEDNMYRLVQIADRFKINEVQRE